MFECFPQCGLRRVILILSYFREIVRNRWIFIHGGQRVIFSACPRKTQVRESRASFLMFHCPDFWGEWDEIVWKRIYQGWLLSLWLYGCCFKEVDQHPLLSLPVNILVRRINNFKMFPIASSIFTSFGYGKDNLKSTLHLFFY